MQVDTLMLNEPITIVTSGIGTIFGLRGPIASLGEGSKLKNVSITKTNLISPLYITEIVFKNHLILIKVAYILLNIRKVSKFPPVSDKLGRGEGGSQLKSPPPPPPGSRDCELSFPFT